MSSYKCIRSFKSAGKGSFFYYGEKIAELTYKAMSSLEKRNFEEIVPQKEKIIEDSDSSNYDSSFTDFETLNILDDETPQSNFDIPDTSSFNSDFDFGGGNSGGGGATGDW
jgi:uncharacterized membrane protein YgcG